MNTHRTIPQVLEDSQLFTCVTSTRAAIIYTNNSRGVVAIIDIDTRQLASMFFDRGGDEYYSAGFYNAEELQNYVFPVMRNDAAWKHYRDGTDDITMYLPSGKV
jgi:hypothetical protein